MLHDVLAEGIYTGSDMSSHLDVLQRAHIGQIRWHDGCIDVDLAYASLYTLLNEIVVKVAESMEDKHNIQFR